MRRGKPSVKAGARAVATTQAAPSVNMVLAAPGDLTQTISMPSWKPVRIPVLPSIQVKRRIERLSSILIVLSPEQHEEAQKAIAELRMNAAKIRKTHRDIVHQMWRDERNQRRLQKPEKPADDFKTVWARTHEVRRGLKKSREQVYQRLRTIMYHVARQLEEAAKIALPKVRRDEASYLRDLGLPVQDGPLTKSVELTTWSPSVIARSFELAPLQFFRKLGVKIEKKGK
jgi:hypothetical protein